MPLRSVELAVLLPACDPVGTEAPCDAGDVPLVVEEATVVAPPDLIAEAAFRTAESAEPEAL